MRRVLLIAGLLLCGCGKADEPQRAAVKGRIMLDDVPIAEGTIAFYPADGTKGPSAGGRIQDSHYAIAASEGPVVGRNRVEVHASKKTGRKVQEPGSEPGVMTDEIVEVVPDRYHSNSILAAEIRPGKNTLDYELTSK